MSLSSGLKLFYSPVLSNFVSAYLAQCTLVHQAIWRLALHFVQQFFGKLQSFDNFTINGLKVIGAGDEIRTHDPNLGKVVLYP